MTQIEKLLKRTKELESILVKNGISLEVEDKIPSYRYSQISYNQLQDIVDIKESFDDNIFDEWFGYEYKLLDEDVEFLSKLINKFIKVMRRFKEESLKVLFIAPVLNRVDFFSMQNRFTGLYDEPLTYKSEKFILNGETDFMFARGLSQAEKPYFFIQEFKQEKGSSEPEPQLLAELISAVELNNQNIIKGSYIKGSIWRFVILKRLKKHHYEYFVSANFDSSKIEDLKGIFKNLMFVKNEVIETIGRNIDE